MIPTILLGTATNPNKGDNLRVYSNNQEAV